MAGREVDRPSAIDTPTHVPLFALLFSYLSVQSFFPHFFWAFFVLFFAQINCEHFFCIICTSSRPSLPGKKYNKKYIYFWFRCLFCSRPGNRAKGWGMEGGTWVAGGRWRGAWPDSAQVCKMNFEWGKGECKSIIKGMGEVKSAKMQNKWRQIERNSCESGLLWPGLLLERWNE